MPYEPELIDIKARWTERKKQEAQRHNAQVMEDYSIAARAENRLSRGRAAAQRQIDYGKSQARKRHGPTMA